MDSNSRNRVHIKDEAEDDYQSFDMNQRFDMGARNSPQVDTAKAIETSLKVQRKILKYLDESNKLLRHITLESRTMGIGQKGNKVFKPTKIIPATTPEELTANANHENIIAMLVRAKESSLSRTVGSMAKILMTRDLAMQFSMSGLGHGRKMCKLPFKNTVACLRIEDAVASIPEFALFTRKDIHGAIISTLKNAVDWGGVRKRNVNAAQFDENNPRSKVPRQNPRPYSDLSSSQSDADSSRILNVE